MSSLRGLQRWLQPYAQALISQFHQLTVTNVWRSRGQQIRLWNKRRNNPYPVAPPGHSKHELGLAWDMVGPPELLARAGAIWNSWGGHWSPADAIHFEYAGHIGRRRRRG